MHRIHENDAHEPRRRARRQSLNFLRERKTVNIEWSRDYKRWKFPGIFQSAIIMYYIFHLLFSRDEIFFYNTFSEDDYYLLHISFYIFTFFFFCKTSQ